MVAPQKGQPINPTPNSKVRVVTVTIATINNKYFKAVLFSFFIVQMYK